MKKNASGYYEKRIDIGHHPETGKRIRKAIRAKSIAELDRKVFAFKQELKSKAPVPDEDITFSAYAERWFRTKATKSINTRNMYRLYLDRTLIPELGELYFTEINFNMLQDIINRSFSHPNTCYKLRLTLKQIYEAAADEGLPNTAFNFRRLVMPPKKKIVEKRALTDEEKEAIFKADLTDMERAYIYVLYYAGLRREEALALDRSSFDFVKKTVTVSKVVVYDRNRTVVCDDTAKNEYSLRTVPLPSPCIDVLKSYSESVDGYMFRSANSTLPLSRTAYQDFFDRIRKKLLSLAPSAKTLTAHIFRHNYATMLYYSNISIKQAAKLMGHGSTQMITEVYAHLDEKKERTAEKLEEVFK